MTEIKIDIKNFIISTFPESGGEIKDVISYRSRTDNSFNIVVILNKKNTSFEEKILFELKKIGNFNVEFFISELIVNKDILLMLLKIIQPADTKKIESNLKINKISFFEKQLNYILDTLVREKLAIWNKEKGYTLTEQALRIIPSGAFRGSSDVKRALEISKKFK